MPVDLTAFFDVLLTKGIAPTLLVWLLIEFMRGNLLAKATVDKMIELAQKKDKA